MSKKIIGNTQKLNNPKIVGSGVVCKDISVDVDSYLNRKTTSGTLSKYLKAAGGFNRGLWQPPLVGELPDGELYLFDGDHRRALWRIAYPNKTTMPAQILKVSDKAQISKLFVHINKLGRKSLTPNEVFVHEYYSGQEDARITANHLASCNLSVALGTKEKGSVVGAINSPTVLIQGFRSLLNSSGLDAAQEASAAIQNLWTKQKIVRIELLRGLARVFSSTPFSDTHRSAFDNFLHNYQNLFGTQNDLSTHFKLKGGQKGNKDEQCVALGILLSFRGWAKNAKGKDKITLKTFNKSYSAIVEKLQAEIG